MQLLVGLGNPGSEYTKTRHNAGFLFIEYVANMVSVSFLEKRKFHAQVAQPNSELVLAKPNTFMNKSGYSVQALRAFYRIQTQDIFVAFDDLDLEIGQVKAQYGRGPKTHNGLQSIYQSLGTEQFWHLRIGVDSRAGDRTIPPEKYVLQTLTDSELHILSSGFLALKDNIASRNLIAVPGRA